MAKEEMKKILAILEGTEQDMAAMEKGTIPVRDVIGKITKALEELRTESAALGIKGLAQVAEKMQQYITQSSLSAEELTGLAFGLGCLRSGVADGSAESIRSASLETLEILGVEPLDLSVPFGNEPKKAAKNKESSWMPEHIEAPPAAEIEQIPLEPEPDIIPEEKPAVPSEKGASGITQLERAAEQLGGKIVPSPDGSSESFMIEFPSENIDKVKSLLAPLDLEDPLVQKLSSQDEHLKEVIETVRDFMAAFAGGDLGQAQEVLDKLAGYQGEEELYGEIGGLARGLHDSLKSLSDTLDPGLKELVEEKIPDSGNRLEHILQLTEEAANTTLDHAEAVRKRIKESEASLVRLERHLARLKPIGDTATERMDDSTRIIRELRDSLAKNDEDMGTILTAQGYQDLTGQVIAKVVNFQKDLEGRLIAVVKSFGMKVTKKRKEKGDELYGPAHEKMEGAVHSQDEIDSILAQFGF